MKHWFFERKEQDVFAKYTDSSDGINSLTSTPFVVVEKVTCWANKPEQDGAPRYSILVHHDIGTHVYIAMQARINCNCNHCIASNVSHDAFNM